MFRNSFFSNHSLSEQIKGGEQLENLLVNLTCYSKERSSKMVQGTKYKQKLFKNLLLSKTKSKLLKKRDYKKFP